MYELLHHLHFAAELCGQFGPMSPSDYKLFVNGINLEDFEWAREICPFGSFAHIHYADKFVCNPDAIREVIEL